jgi:hypothetical protein
MWVRADLDPVVTDVDHQRGLVVTEITGKTEGDMTDEHVGPISGADGDAPIWIVDFEHDRLAEVNGDTFLAPRISISGVRHDHSSRVGRSLVQGT